MNHFPTATTPTMSSREIAELTGKEHRNVMADIRTQLGQLLGEEGLLRFQQSYRNAQRQEYIEQQALGCTFKRSTL